MAVIFDEPFDNLTNWTAIRNNLAVSSGAVWSNTASDYGASYQSVAGSLSSPLEIVIDCTLTDTNDNSRVYWHSQNSARNAVPGDGDITGYNLLIYSSEIRVERDGANIASYTATTTGDGDQLRITHVGSQITVDRRVGAGSWTQIISVVDSTYDDGWITLYVFNNVGAKIGNLTVSTVSESAFVLAPPQFH
jgi:hypothetical protein